MDLGLKGKSVIVTGGGSNIGRAITLGFAKEGANLTVADIEVGQAEKVADEARKLGAGDVQVIETDVTDFDAVGKMVAAVRDKYGRVDVLVNNVGWDRLMFFAQTTPEQYAWMFGGGVCNAIAFYSIAKCLQLVSVARVNALNASQLAMVALVGTILFEEAVTFGLVSGVALTIAGLLVMHRGSAV